MLVSATNDGTLRLYDCISPNKLKTIFCKKYGINLVRFTHHSNAVICASTNSHQFGEDVLRYLSLHDNKYLRYFRGHSDKVVSLEMSPKSDMFLSAQRDGVVRLWDLNSNVCQVSTFNRTNYSSFLH